MKKSSLLFTVASVSFCLSCVFVTAQRKKYNNFSISTGSERTITGCDQIRMRVDDREVERFEQDKVIPLSSASPLQVRATHHGGIQVQGWHGDHYAIKACMGVVGDSLAEVRSITSQISMSFQDGLLTVNGPNEELWMAYLIIQAPNGAAMNLEAKNSPIGISAFSGTIEARNQNGPLSLFDVDGKVRADVMNGPITVSGSRGDHRLYVQNGPLTVDLTGSRWESGELEGHTQNGPVTLKLPPDYQSPVRVDASEHSPIQCRAAQCKDSPRTWDKPNRIEFGSSDPVIRLSTVNGPVTIK